MKKFMLLILLLSGLGLKMEVMAQSEPVLYFCEKYDKGEIGVKDWFPAGKITVVVRCDHALGLTEARLQFDKYDCSTGKFDYYTVFDYDVDPGMSYIFFSDTDSNDLKIEDPGFYRVFLLDKNDNTVASAMIEIID